MVFLRDGDDLAHLLLKVVEQLPLGLEDSVLLAGDEEGQGLVLARRHLDLGAGDFHGLRHHLHRGLRYVVAVVEPETLALLHGDSEYL